MSQKIETEIHRKRECDRTRNRIRITAAHFTVAEIAKRLEVTPQTVRNWLNGTHPMRPAAAAQILEMNREIEGKPKKEAKKTGHENGQIESEFGALCELTEELLPHEKLKLAQILIGSAIGSY